MPTPFEYSQEPEDHTAFTSQMNDGYTRFAGVYDWCVRFLPVWKTWLRRTLDHIQGPRVLEVSFGTGYLLAEIAQRHPRVFGIDYNQRMVEVATRQLARSGAQAQVSQANVEALPFEDASFDTVVCTMAFSGYPDGRKALAEIRRVLAPDGQLVLLDPAPPEDGNRLGLGMCKFWQGAGDILRDMPALLEEMAFRYEDVEIGGFGSIHLYIASPDPTQKRAPKGA